MKNNYSPILLSVALLFSSTAHSMTIPQFSKFPTIKLEDIKDHAIGGLAALTVLLTGSVIYLTKQVSTMKKEMDAKFAPADPNDRFIDPNTFAGLRQELSELKIKVKNFIEAVGVEKKSGDKTVMVALEEVASMLGKDGEIDRRFKNLEEPKQKKLGSSSIAEEHNLLYIDEAIKKKITTLSETFVTKEEFTKSQEVFVTRSLLDTYLKKQDFETSKAALIASIKYNTDLSEEHYKLIEVTHDDVLYKSAKKKFDAWKEENKKPQL